MATISFKHMKEIVSFFVCLFLSNLYCVRSLTFQGLGWRSPTAEMCFTTLTEACRRPLPPCSSCSSCTGSTTGNDVTVGKSGDLVWNGEMCPLLHKYVKHLTKVFILRQTFHILTCRNQRLRHICGILLQNKNGLSVVFHFVGTAFVPGP